MSAKRLAAASRKVLADSPEKYFFTGGIWLQCGVNCDSS
jgi:hypothetical protein